ncbi:MAG TPA: lysoplasmalogenase [Cyclobacteriaceae bacterium]
MKNKFLILFSLVFVLELLAVAWPLVWLEYVTKPLIMIVMGAYYITSMRGQDSTLSKPVLIAMLFSFLGDAVLLFQQLDNLYFMLGLGSFLLAHIGYILAYYQHKNSRTGTPLLGVQKFRFAFPIILAGTGLITILYSHLGDLKIPVIIYSMVLIVMVLKALFRFGYTSSRSFWLVFVGALLFMISDSLIAITKFLSGFELAGLAIMCTYMLAQFLIISGLLVHHE